MQSKLCNKCLGVWAMPIPSAAKWLELPATIDYAVLQALGNQGTLLRRGKHNRDPLAVENRKHTSRLHPIRSPFETEVADEKPSFDVPGGSLQHLQKA